MRQQLDSYNTFLGHTLLEQIKDQSDRGIEVESNVQVVSNLSLVRFSIEHLTKTMERK